VTTPDDEDVLAPGAEVDETNVRVVGGDAGWAPAEASGPGIPVLRPEDRTWSVPQEPIGTEASQPEMLHASTTVQASGPVSEDWYSSFVPAPAAATAVTTVSAGTIVVTRSRADRWAPILSAGIGSVVILVGLVLGAASAYYYGDTAACAAYSKAHHGSAGFGCAATQRKLAVLAPLVGMPLMVVGWLAWTWIPERTGTRRVQQCLGLLLAGVVAVLLVMVGIHKAVR